MFGSKRSWLVKLIDFSKAQKINNKKTVVDLKQLKFSPLPSDQFAEWMAPEVLLKENESINLYESNLRLFNSLLNGNSLKKNNEFLTSKKAKTCLSSTTPPLNSMPANADPNPQTDIWGLGLITFCL